MERGRPIEVTEINKLRIATQHLLDSNVVTYRDNADKLAKQLCTVLEDFEKRVCELEEFAERWKIYGSDGRT